MSDTKHNTHYQVYCNHLTFELPIEAVNDCSHQGECFEDVEHWQKELSLDLPRKPMIRELLECGAWSVRELCALEDYELEQKLIWVGAHDIKEELAV